MRLMHTLHNYIVLDVETTGLDASVDEIIQLAIIDGTGAVLFNKLIKPMRVRVWQSAQQVHGITPELLLSEQPFSAYRDVVQQIIDDHAVIVAYNAAFDLGFLKAAGINLDEKSSFCLMKAFAPIYGQRRRGGQGFVWKSLDVCAQYYGITNLKVHDALGDAQTTLACLMAMLESGAALPNVGFAPC